MENAQASGFDERRPKHFCRGKHIDAITKLLPIEISEIEIGAPNRRVGRRERLRHCGMKPQTVIRALCHELPQ